MAQYKIQDELTGKVYTFEGDYSSPPTQEEIEDTVFRTISAGKAKPVQDLEKRVLGEETYNLYRGEQIPLALQTGYNWVSRQIDRPVGAVRALVSAQDPVKGFVNPEQTQSFGESAVKAWGITDPVQAKWVGITTDIAAGLGTLHLTFSTLPQAATGLVKQAQSLYNGTQRNQLLRLKNALVEEFKISGMDDKAASIQSDVVIAHQFNKARFNEKTPWNIQKL